MRPPQMRHLLPDCVAVAIVMGKTNLDQLAPGPQGTRRPHSALRSVFSAD